MLRSILREFICPVSAALSATRSAAISAAVSALMPAVRGRAFARGMQRWVLLVLIGLLPLQSIAATLQITCATLAQTTSGNRAQPAAGHDHHGMHAPPAASVAHHEHAGAHPGTTTIDPGSEPNVDDAQSWDSAHDSGSCAACALCCLSAALIVSPSSSDAMRPAAGVSFAPAPPLLAGVIPPGIERPPRH